MRELIVNVLARARFLSRRARWLLAMVGIGVSALLLAVTFDRPVFFMASDFTVREGIQGSAILSFLVLNPPAILIIATFRSLFAPLPLFLLSVIWWSLLAVLIRRKRARQLDTAVV